MSFPKMLPTVSEVLDALAFEIAQHDALREANGKPPRHGKVTYSHEELRAGHGCCPCAEFNDAGGLYVRLES